MDLRAFYQKIRDAAAAIDEPFPIVVSLATADGGKPGRPIEVTRQVAAKMMVEGIGANREPGGSAAVPGAAGRSEAPGGSSGGRGPKVQLTVLTTAELNRLKSAGKRT